MPVRVPDRPSRLLHLPVRVPYRLFRQFAHHPDQIRLALKADAGQLGHHDIAILDAHAIGEASVGLEEIGIAFVAAKPETCEKKPQLCEAVGQTFKETSAWMHAHPDDAEALLKKRFPTLDPRVFHASFETELKITPNPPVPTAKGIENTDNYNIEAGLMKPSVKQSDYNKLFTDKYVK